ncbi:uncharacterized protein LOC124354827 [Homalodisca vitripennis]|uniref:uncharacterized protein LOC124354827 n=1 Tax=Homalodisca vitripennis TaxID=197043 RepID=UPI001EEC23C4|nr:uncharacterized protein LOC124354827 [Homalodisca vitripennis]
MDEIIPSWLDKHFVTACITGDPSQDRSNCTVSSFDVSSVLPPGNNYAANLLRVKVTYNNRGKTCTQFMIVKSLIENNLLSKIFYRFFETEPVFYNTYLPEALKVNRNLPVPKPFFSPIPDVIVMEDLSEMGYKLPDRCQMLDFEHCKLFVTASAIFSAVSVAIHKKHPEIVASLAIDPFYSKDLADNCAELHKTLMTKGLLCMAEHIAETEQFKKYSKVVRDCAYTTWDKVIELHKPSNKLNVLQQSDAWTGNVMFKYDNYGKVKDIKILDFQALRYSSPASSLIFFLWTSANHEVRERHLEDLYEIYCDVLNENLAKLKCPERVSLDEFLDDMQLLSPAVLAIAAYFFPPLTNPCVMDFERRIALAQSDGENPYEESYGENYCKDSFLRILSQLERCGVFNNL